MMMMMESSIRLCLLLLAAVACGVVGNTDIMLGHRKAVAGFSLGPAPFPAFQDMDFELFQDAFVRDDCVKVTDAEQHQRGAIWAKRVYALERNKHEFQADFTFRVGGSPNENFFGDGFALWFVQNERGVGGTALGGPNKWHGLGIFFDTYKNHEFKGKRHPFVYGVTSNGEKNYDDLALEDIDNQGCHIPFRNSDPSVLDTTVARVTYKRNKISVVMQPLGADDWVKCFQIRNVELPPQGYFGVTAMTGDLVDKHEMVSIELFNRILEDPWEYAAEHNLKLMPEMWNDMKYSGEVAREFENWELEIEEEVSWSLKDHYADYVDPYYGYDDRASRQNYVIDDTYHDRGYEPEPEPEKVEKPSYKNNYQRGVKKGNRKTGGHGLTAEEIDNLDMILADTEIAKEIGKIHRNKHERIKKLRQHIESEFSVSADKMSVLAKRLLTKEHELSLRIMNLGAKLHVDLDEAFQTQKAAGSGWLWPFIIVLIIIAGGTTYGFTKYRTHMKTHLL